MRNELALSGEKLDEKVYPQLFHHVGMIRGEYLLRELNQNILLPSCKEFVKDYLDTICSLYSDEEVWYRFSELTNTEANCLKGTKEYFDENHPLFGYRGTRRLLMCQEIGFLSKSPGINFISNRGVDLLVGIPYFLRCHGFLLCNFLLSSFICLR